MWARKSFFGASWLIWNPFHRFGVQGAEISKMRGWSKKKEGGLSKKNSIENERNLRNAWIDAENRHPSPEIRCHVQLSVGNGTYQMVPVAVTLLFSILIYYFAATFLQLQMGIRELGIECGGFALINGFFRKECLISIWSEFAFVLWNFWLECWNRVFWW